MTNTFSTELIEQIKESGAQFQLLKHEIGKVIIGNEKSIDFIIIALLCNGHILLEGVPGVAKTTTIKALAEALGLSFKRVQFTPDLLPADLLGTLIFNSKTHEFETKKGPIFANLILADEINRTPAKVQAALLESMQEYQVTLGSTTYPLEKPFLVFATQNPIEQEGTYRLPEAQIDRFMFKLLIEYLTPEQEKQIIFKVAQKESIHPVVDRDALFSAQQLVRKIYVDQKIVDYIIDLVFATRKPNQALKRYIQYGVSPRATLALYAASQAQAFLKKRHFVIPDDVKAIAPAILRHRIAINYEAEAENIRSDDIIQTILDTIAAP
jgi:MoxR-like ATPase